MQDPHVAAAAVPSATADSQPLSINPTTTAVPSDHVASPSTAVVETATAAQCSSPGALQPILTCRSNSCDMATAEGMSRPAAEAGHLIARQSGLQVSGRASSMQSSPIYGLATDGSQTFTPTRGPTAQMPRQGPHRPDTSLLCYCISAAWHGTSICCVTKACRVLTTEHFVFMFVIMYELLWVSCCSCGPTGSVPGHHLSFSRLMLVHSVSTSL